MVKIKKQTEVPGEEGPWKPHQRRDIKQRQQEGGEDQRKRAEEGG
jgi:hypothetical protein